MVMNSHSRGIKLGAKGSQIPRMLENPDSLMLLGLIGERLFLRKSELIDDLKQRLLFRHLKHVEVRRRIPQRKVRANPALGIEEASLCSLTHLHLSSVDGREAMKEVPRVWTHESNPTPRRGEKKLSHKHY
jgi:hypothetical protein